MMSSWKGNTYACQDTLDISTLFAILMRIGREVMNAILAAEDALSRRNQYLLIRGDGDFHPKNILIGQDDPHKHENLYIAAIDFGSSYCLPTVFDIGTFLAQYQNQLLYIPEILQKSENMLFFGCLYFGGRPDRQRLIAAGGTV